MKKTFVNKEQLEKICAEYPTPFHLYDEKGIRENARRMKEAFSWNPGFKEDLICMKYMQERKMRWSI